jgi:hypothetical protein
MVDLKQKKLEKAKKLRSEGKTIKQTQELLKQEFGSELDSRLFKGIVTMRIVTSPSKKSDIIKISSIEFLENIIKILEKNKFLDPSDRLAEVKGFRPINVIDSTTYNIRMINPKKMIINIKIDGKKSGIEYRYMSDGTHEPWSEIETRNLGYKIKKAIESGLKVKINEIKSVGGQRMWDYSENYRIEIDPGKYIFTDLKK